MSQTKAASDKGNSKALFASRFIVCGGPLARYCRALVAVDVQPRPGVTLTLVPHNATILSIQFADRADPLARCLVRGTLPQLCSMRDDAMVYEPSGGCRTLFALLTPEGALALVAGQSLSDLAGPRRALAQLMSCNSSVALEDTLLSASDPVSQMGRLGAWIENAAQSRRPIPWQARRIARIAAEVASDPFRDVQQVAQTEGISRRQLERDFRRWLATSPKHASLVAKTQTAARLAVQGMPLADLAYRLGFADQPHMNRVVKAITGRTPRALLHGQRGVLAQTFRQATGGGLVYL